MKNGTVWSGGCICQFNSLVVQSVLKKNLLLPYIAETRERNVKQYQALTTAISQHFSEGTAVFNSACGGYFVWIKLSVPTSPSSSTSFSESSMTTVADGSRSPKRVKTMSATSSDSPSSPTVVDTAQFLAFAKKEYKVSFKAGAGFFSSHDLSSPPPEKCDTFIRLCFAREEATLISEGVKRIGLAWTHFCRQPVMQEK